MSIYCKYISGPNTDQKWGCLLLLSTKGLAPKVDFLLASLYCEKLLITKNLIKMA